MAFSQNFVERLTRQLQCEVCCNDFDNETYIPKLIPCGHTLCVRCLEGLMKAEPASRGVKILQCPKRCKSFPVPREGAKGFMTVRDLLVIRDMHVEEEEQRARSTDLCDSHHIAKKYYCVDCKIQVCSECALERHGAHAASVVKYDDIFGDCKEALQSAVQRAKQTFQETRGLLHAMREVATLLRKTELRMQTDVDDLDKLLAGAETATESRNIVKMKEIAETISPIVEFRDTDNASLNNCRFRRIMLILKSLAQNESQRPPVKSDSGSILSQEDQPDDSCSIPDEHVSPVIPAETQPVKPVPETSKTHFNQDTTMKQKQIYSTKTVSDNREPFNVYMVMDGNDNMYTTDNFNNKFKCFNINGQCYFETSRIGHLENIRLRNPLGVSLLPGQPHLALLDGDLNDCYILSTEDFALKSKFNVLNCRGVAGLPSSLVVTTTTARVHIIDSETNSVVRTLERDASGKQLFHCPYYACGQPNTQNVIISDTVHGMASIRLMDTRTGDVVQSYQGMKLQSPKGLSFDQSGQLLVADDERNTVSLFSSEMQFVCDLITAETGASEPIGASVASSNKIMVAEKKGKIKQFEILS